MCVCVYLFMCFLPHLYKSLLVLFDHRRMPIALNVKVVVSVAMLIVWKALSIFLVLDGAMYCIMNYTSTFLKHASHKEHWNKMPWIRSKQMTEANLCTTTNVHNDPRLESTWWATVCCVVWSTIHMYPVPSHLRQILHSQICGEKHIER